MTDDEQNAEIANMAVERAELKRAIVCMTNKVARYRKALSQASVALARDVHLRETGDGVIVPAIDGLFDGGKERELPSLSEIAALRKGRMNAQTRLKELDQALDDFGIVG